MRFVLAMDAMINFLLGLFLILYPERIVSYFGLPVTYEPFYPSLLGAVLIGIALALVIECACKPGILGGLGIGGAITINICGACVILLWLVSGRLIIPLRGYLVLWILVFVLLILSGIELLLCESEMHRSSKKKEESSEDNRS